MRFFMVLQLIYGGALNGHVHYAHMTPYVGYCAEQPAADAITERSVNGRSRVASYEELIAMMSYD